MASPLQRAPRLLLLLAVAYALLAAMALLPDPLVLAPQLDAAENLALARQIENGQLPAEPFYRSPLYPALLSLLHPADWRPVLGAFAGFLCHLLNAFLIARLAQSWTQERRTAAFAAALYLIYPVSLFYSTLLLDVTPAITAALGGLLCLLNPARQRLLPGAGLLTVAALLRPHFLLLAAAAPALAALSARRFSPRYFTTWIPLAAGLLLFGTLNFLHSGQFRVLPWQGSFNLYAANHSGANGLYFTQSIALPESSQTTNPAQAESIRRYAKAHPSQSPPFPVTAMNAFWRERLLHDVATNPLQFARLITRKAYAVLNSFEQYNNYTFAYHRQRLPFLRFNPLNWGILLLLGTAGFVGLLQTRPGPARALLLAAACLTVMLLLFYASARFRLLLVPLLAVASAGLPAAASWIRHSRHRIAATAAAGLALAALTFSSFAGIRSTNTFIQDRLLLANAHAQLGQDLPSARLARQVLADQPQRREARRNYAVAYLNLALAQDPRRIPEFGGWSAQQFLRPVQPLPHDPVLTAAYGIFLHQWLEPQRARHFWQAAATQSNATPQQTQLARACLRLTDSSAPPAPPPPDLQPLANRLQPLLLAPQP